MTTGLKDSLQQGALAAVSKLGQENGFFANAKVKIPSPKAMQNAEKMMRAFGMKKQADDLVLSMNRAAEAAVPEAKELFVGAVKAIEKVGLAQKYNAVTGKMSKLGLVNENESNVENYVTQKALEGLFVMMADEEKALRANPVKASTDIAKKSSPCCANRHSGVMNTACLKKCVVTCSSGMHVYRPSAARPLAQ